MGIPSTSPDAYRAELENQAAAWQRKSALRALYRHWFDLVGSRLVDRGPTLELGCGCGELGDHLGSVIRSDNVATPWCDVVADGTRLPFRTGSLGNVVLMDVIHHIAAPLDVLAECRRVLAPGGRVVLLEPTISLLGRFVYGVLHHEDVDMGYDVTRPKKDHALFANGGIPTLLFGHGRDAWRAMGPGLEMVENTTLTGPSYLLTGGFSYPGVLPACAVRPLQRLEDGLASSPLGRWMALRMLVVLERQEERREETVKTHAGASPD
jgi:SAM-dependent methyltransferase